VQLEQLTPPPSQATRIVIDPLIELSLQCSWSVFFDHLPGLKGKNAPFDTFPPWFAFPEKEVLEITSQLPKCIRIMKKKAACNAIAELSLAYLISSSLLNETQEV
jgi:hypothetical protein